MSDKSVKPDDENRGKLVWAGRPSIGPYVAFYAMISMLIMIVLITAEYLAGRGIARSIIPNSMTLARITIPYPLEVATAVIIVLAFLAKLISLALTRARSKYDLYDDGLYMNLGIVNLESTFLTPMAFSDARLIRTWTLRIAGR
ncbi:MAG: hypothetical protein ACYC9U_13605, partial [Nitrososphaerales archaeon]